MSTLLEIALQTAMNLCQQENLIIKRKYLKRKAEIEVLREKVSENELLIKSLEQSNVTKSRKGRRKRYTGKDGQKQRRIRFTEIEIEAIEKGIRLFGNRKCSDIKKQFATELCNRSGQQIQDWIRNDIKRKASYLS